MDEPFELHRGAWLTIAANIPDNSIDAIVIDPPYHLSAGKKGGTGAASVNPNSPAGRSMIGTGFMGMAWDGGDMAFDVATWREALRVLKPGGHLLAFSGPRTYHRMVCAIEDAGFEVRDQIGWLYGSGFPKSRDIAEHDMEGDDAERWRGWGTALKPAWEPICVARKPLIGTVAANVLEHGTGALNIDACRVPTSDDLNGGAYAETGGRTVSGSLSPTGMNVPGKTAGREFEQPEGRWPANVIHDGSDEVLEAFPQAPGQLSRSSSSRTSQNVYGAMQQGSGGLEPRGDAGSAARFFYCAKASRGDRNDGLQSSDTPAVGTGATMRKREDADWSERNGNFHPTVKPTDLMRYLVRLVTPPGGTVLDFCMGSGSTGKACMLEGFRFIGVDLDSDKDGNPIGYLDIARARIRHAWFGVLIAQREAAEAIAAAERAPKQFDLLEAAGIAS